MGHWVYLRLRTRTTSKAERSLNRAISKNLAKHNINLTEIHHRLLFALQTECLSDPAYGKALFLKTRETNMNQMKIFDLVLNPQFLTCGEELQASRRFRTLHLELGSQKLGIWSKSESGTGVMIFLSLRTRIEFDIIQTDLKTVMDGLMFQYHDNLQNSIQNFRHLGQKWSGNWQFSSMIYIDLDSTSSHSRILVVSHFIQQHSRYPTI
jgi:hypothetical protein